MAKLVQHQITLSNLNIIEKNPCSYNPEKSVIIFLDDRAQKSLRRFRVTVTKILTETNEVFAEHGLPNRYNLKNLKIRSWSTEKKDCIFRDTFPDETTCFLNEMMPRYRTERKHSNPDVVIFMTATGISDVSGVAYWKKRDGNGSIILNIGVDLKSYDSDKRIREVAKRFFLRRFAHLSTHEQTHLYGVAHSTDNARSIMYPFSNAFGDRRVKFDKQSLHILTEREKELDKKRSQCAAQK